MDWFRMYGEFASDPKVQSMSEALQRRLMMLLCLRCSNTLVTLQDDEIAFALRISDEELASSKAIFVRKGFIDEAWEILNWDKRQFVSDSSAARVAKHRALKKEALKPVETTVIEASNVTVTPQNRTDTEQIQNRTDSKQSRKENPKEQPIAAAVAAALEIPAEEKDPADTARRSAARATWDAYCQAYFDRYGADPVRNAKVNSGILQFVDRLEHAECAAVARFFVSHNNSFYVREMHAVGLMVKDAEKLRTEWATNSRMTQTKALQADKTATNLDAFAPLIAAARAKEEAERIANAQ